MNLINNFKLFFKFKIDDHNRVKLVANKENESDYINASLITDDDPKNPAYIATQGPLLHTTSNFWQMVWEQNSVIIVSLCRTVEYGSSKCNQYWPINGNETYGEFEVHLVSEHVWCEDYLVRSFYLMNKATNQTRTVTQFQFLTWPENCMPPNVKSILDFRRFVTPIWLIQFNLIEIFFFVCGNRLSGWLVNFEQLLWFCNLVNI